MGDRMIDAGTKASIAYVAGRLLSGKETTSIYDYSQSKHILFSGTVNQQAVNVYDHARGCHFGGTWDGTTFNLYDYAGKHHVSLTLKHDEFRGYAFSSR